MHSYFRDKPEGVMQIGSPINIVNGVILSLSFSRWMDDFEYNAKYSELSTRAGISRHYWPITGKTKSGFAGGNRIRMQQQMFNRE